MSNPRVGEIWELPSGRLGRVFKVRPSDRFTSADVLLEDIADGGQRQVLLYTFHELDRVHPPPIEKACIVCGRANGAEVEPGGKRVLLFGCSSQRCAANVCTLPARGPLLSCKDQHFEAAHRIDFERENGITRLPPSKKQRKGA